MFGSATVEHNVIYDYAMMMQITIAFLIFYSPPQHQSTETALLYIYDHLINAIGSQNVSCLSLLDLSAAFDTIDHNIMGAFFYCLRALQSGPVTYQAVLFLRPSDSLRVL